MRVPIQQRKEGTLNKRINVIHIEVQSGVAEAMLHIDCILERVGGISANKVYFRRIEGVKKIKQPDDYKVKISNGVFEKIGDWEVTVSRHTDVLPVHETNLIDEALEILTRQSQPNSFNDTLRYFASAPTLATVSVVDGKIWRIEKKLFQGGPD